MMAFGVPLAHAQTTSPPATAPAPAASPTPANAPLDPTSPLDPMPGLNLPWPDLGKADPIEGTVDATAATNSDAAAERRYSVTVEGLDANSAILEQFDAQSELRAAQGKTANAAQIDLRARNDTELLRALLRAAGYYDADVTTSVAPVDARLAVTLTVEAGTQYRFTDVNVHGLESVERHVPDARETFGVKPDAPVDATAVISGEAALREKLGREGYPFAKVEESQVTVDHETRQATLDLQVDAGTQRRINALRMTDTKLFDAKHLGAIARFGPGTLYDQAMVDDLRRALIATGLVSNAKVEPVAVGEDKVDIVTTLDPAPLRTIAAELGYGTGEGFRAIASWQHRNLIRPEGAVTVRGVAGTREQGLGVTLRMNNFRRRDVVLNGRISASHTVYPAYDAKSFELGGNLERQTNLIWQKPWTWSYGAELIATDERDFVPTIGINQRRTYFIGALPATLAYDGSDDLLNPTGGYRVSARVSPEVSLRGTAYTYVRAQIDASKYQSINSRVILAGRVRIGSIVGAGQYNIAPSRKFYGGGGGSVRGFGYQALGPRNVLGAPVGGRSLVELAAEARIRLPNFGGNFGIVPFVDAGNVYDSQLPKFTGLRVGAGMGLRYYSNFGPIRIDVGTPIARRPGEGLIAVYVSLGHAF